MVRITAGVVAALLMSASAFAQDTRQDPTTTQVEDVVVEGRRLGEMIERFVDDVSAPAVGGGPARWDRKVCVGAVNLRRDAAQVVADQVSRVALELGLQPGDPGCRPNILVVATDDGAALASTLVRHSPRAFRPNYTGAARRPSALARFQAGQAPVRWWHVSMPMTEFGYTAVRLPGEDYPWVRQDASRLTTRIQNDLLLVWVIVDLTKMEGITFQQLGDYIGMVAMAQIDPEAETETYDTVLNLFETPGRIDGLTAWDRSYLSALYGAELDNSAANQQVGEVSQIMFRDRQRADRDHQNTPTLPAATRPTD